MTSAREQHVRAPRRAVGRRPAVPYAVCALGAVLVAGTVRTGDAHKPITSPYTFTREVQPILERHCTSCHVDGGIAPMALTTYEKVVPWAQAMRMELIGGQMPPWRIDGNPGRFRNAPSVSPRDLNILLTWAAGGTPRGDAEAPDETTFTRRWPLGEPDVTLPASRFTLGAGVQTHVEEFVLATGLEERRMLTAVDVMPGAPQVVRAATVSIRTRRLSGDAPDSSPPYVSPRGRGAVAPEERLALWVPGDRPVPLDRGLGFALPEESELVLRVYYRKTWLNERDTITDQTTVGLYFGEGSSEVEALELAPGPGDAVNAGTLTFARMLDGDMRAIAIYPRPALGDAALSVIATRPDGSREDLIAFRALTMWARRYWYVDPVQLPRGTRIDVTARLDPGSALLPPGAPRREPVASNDVRITLNVVR